MVRVWLSEAVGWFEYVEPIYITDDTPVVKVRFAPGTMPRLAASRPPSGGSWVPSQPKTEPDGSCNWSWNIFGGAKDTGRMRRVGWFRLDFIVPNGLRLEIFVDSLRIFTGVQFRLMVSDIREIFPVAVWDLEEGAPPVGTIMSPARAPADIANRIALLLSDLRRESVVAGRAVRLRRWEPGPLKPGRRDNSRERFSRNYDLAENRAVRLWVWRRIADIDYAISAVHDARRSIELQLNALGSAEQQERATRESACARFGMWHEELRARRARLRALDTDLADRGVSLGIGSSFASARSEVRWLQMRQDRSYVGLSALDTSNGDLSILEDEHVNDKIALRPVAALYELWVAVRCARVLVEALGFEKISDVHNSRVEFLPKFFKMSFACSRRGQLTLEFGRRMIVEKPPSEYPRMAKFDALWRTIRKRGESGLFTMSDSSTPDYVMTLCRNGSTALCLGDATCTDFTHGGADATRSKRAKVSDYARNALLVGPSGQLTRPSEAASFVCVPSASHGVADEPSSPVVVCATPGDDASLIQGISAVIDSLDWYCRTHAERAWGAP